MKCVEVVLASETLTVSRVPQGVEVGVLVLAVELVPAKNRPLAPFMLFVAYSLGHCLLPVLAYFFKSWRYFQLTIALGSAVLLPITR